MSTLNNIMEDLHLKIDDCRVPQKKPAVIFTYFLYTIHKPNTLLFKE